MVNGNYVVYGDRPSSDSEIVDDHIHRSYDRKNKRKINRTANELQHSLNLAQLDNETDSVKYEKKIKEPRLLRYVPTSEVKENFITEKFETYDLKPTEERPRRYAFTKKPKNPADGSVNYAYSRSSSSCSSPNGNLPTISEHGEQYGTYRVRPLSAAPAIVMPNPTINDLLPGYDTKLDKYFAKPRDGKPFSAKVGYNGSHPDSLYRVSADNGAAASKVTRALRVLRWPVALVLVCVALAVFVYFLMPDNLESRTGDNSTYWEPLAAGQRQPQGRRREQQHGKKPAKDDHGTKTSEIDFNDAEIDRNHDFQSAVDAMANEVPKRKLSIPPVFPTHLTPEVQYGNEKADTDNLRTAKVLGDADTDDSTLKPHITQKPERPLAIYLKKGTAATTEVEPYITQNKPPGIYVKNGTASTTEVKPHITEKSEKPLAIYITKGTAATREVITRAETINDSTNFDHIQVTKKKLEYAQKNKSYGPTGYLVHPGPRYDGADRYVPLEVQEFYNHRPKPDISFTSGHSKLFGISIEDAETIKSTTQSSLYNTRVSPTLPTWRDGDDTTTKKYPSNIYSEVQCHSTRMALCRGILPYDLAGAPAKIGDIEVTSLLSQIDYLVATNCSERVKHFMCALLEPECNPPPFPTKMPCYGLCKAVVDACDGQIPAELTPAFKCQSYPRSNCVEAKTPCYPREFTCNDGSCVSRDWLCDGTRDCPGGEDEAATCIKCDQSEYRCSSGGCILKRWLCDGYSDCPDGEDEHVQTCGERAPHAHVAGAADTHEPGEESAGSAPAPTIRRPNRVSTGRKATHQRAGENESSKELLVTSDSNNSLKRNFTRRPSPSRLLPYHHPQPTKLTKTVVTPVIEDIPIMKDSPKVPEEEKVTQGPQKPNAEKESLEDVNIGDLGFFDEFDKDGKEVSEPTERPAKTVKFGVPMPNKQRVRPAEVNPSLTKPTRYNKTSNNFDVVIDGAALLKKAAAEHAAEVAEDQASNDTLMYADDIPDPIHATQTQDETPILPISKSNQGTEPLIRLPVSDTNAEGRGWSRAHASPCPSGELRCVDGRCITLAQLCDGTIDCSDHADEDNCYT